MQSYKDFVDQYHPLISDFVECNILQKSSTLRGTRKLPAPKILKYEQTTGESGYKTFIVSVISMTQMHNFERYVRNAVEEQIDFSDVKNITPEMIHSLCSLCWKIQIIAPNVPACHCGAPCKRTRKASTNELIFVCPFKKCKFKESNKQVLKHFQRDVVTTSSLTKFFSNKKNIINNKKKL